MIKMSKEYYSDIQFPILYTSFPQDQTITDVTDSTINLKIRSKGFNLFSSIYFSKKEPFKLNLKNLEIHSNRYTTGNYLLADEILVQIRKQFETPADIVSISPDTLYFQLEQIIYKEVPIQLNLSYSIKKQFGIYGELEYSNDTILISGPPSIINTIELIQSEKVSLQDLNQNTTIKIALIKPKHGLVDLSADSMSVSIPIEEFTESVLNIPLGLVNEGSHNIRLFPNEVKLTFLVALKDFQTVNSEMFLAEINFNPNRQRTQKVELKKYPGFVKISRMEPNIVEYLILK